MTSGEPGERSERLSEAFGVPHEDDGAWIHNKAERSRVTHNAAEYLCGTGSRPSLDRELGGENPPECSKMREALVEGFSLHLDNCPQTTAAPTAGSANIGQSYGQISKSKPISIAGCLIRPTIAERSFRSVRLGHFLVSRLTTCQALTTSVALLGSKPAPDTSGLSPMSAL